MKKFLFFISIFSFTVTIIQAQTAKEWLEKVNNTYQEIPTYYIKFTLKDPNFSKVETGEVYASKDRYSLDIIGIKQIYDGKSLFTVSKEDKEVTISNPKPDSDDLFTPTKVLNMYNEGFALNLGESTMLDGKKVQLVKLTPISKSNIKYIQVAINISDSTLYQYKEFYKNNDTRTVTVKEYIENLIIPRSLFKFDQSKYEKDGYIVTQL
ncbi:MAG: LolA family protein [Moheibacter sp.]